MSEVSRDFPEALSADHEQMDCWVVIPARGGSREIPRKNLVLCAGKPLIQYAIEAAKTAVSKNRVVLVTDDDEISWFGEQFGIHVVLEAERSGPHETLDEKIFRSIPALQARGAQANDVILTVQPTSPLITPETIRNAYTQLGDECSSVISVVEDRHLNWAQDDDRQLPTPLFESRVNRQLIPPILRETGGVIGARLQDIAEHESRVITPVSLLRIPSHEGIDVDSFGDLFEAEHWISRARIVIRVDAGFALGMGHIYRGVAIAQELARHEVIFAIDSRDSIAGNLLSNFPFGVRLLDDDFSFPELLQLLKPDLLVMDLLDTDSASVRRWRRASPETKIVSFEDNGDGANLCDAQVHDLTPGPSSSALNAVVGIENTILAPSFELVAGVPDRQGPSKDLLVSFGGTDPAGLTEKVLDALEIIEFEGSVTVVTGLGAKTPKVEKRRLNSRYLADVRNMALEVSRHSLAISSMGRTVFELAQLEVPALCFAQNEKELGHIHVGEETGSVFGGQGYAMSADRIANEIAAFLTDSNLHQGLRDSSEPFRSRRSNKKSLQAILQKVGLPLLA